MKKLVLDRRKLLGTALFGSSSMAMAAVPASIFSQLEGEGAEATVAGIVQQYFPLPKGQEAFLGTFYRSLMHSRLHHQDKAYLTRHLEETELREALEVYVIEAFATSTNYLKVSAGEEKALRMIKV